MKKVILILCVLLTYSSTYGQGLNDAKVKTVDKDAISFEKTKALVQSKSFNFLAEWKQIEMGTRETTGGILNQLTIEGANLNCHLQYDNFKSLSDPKESDLIYDDEISNYKVIINDKRQKIEIRYQIKFRASIFNVRMFVRSNGYTELTLEQPHGGSNITYFGKIKSI